LAIWRRIYSIPPSFTPIFVERYGDDLSLHMSVYAMLFGYLILVIEV
jgi:hypothetical protein